MQYVTLINRTSRNLKGVWDGREHIIAPGKHSYPEAQAMKFKDQNPIMGSEDPYTLQKEYLIGIVEQGDNCEPVEQSTARELIDRSKLGEDAQNVRTITNPGLWTPNAIRSSGGLTPDGSFSNPD